MKRSVLAKLALLSPGLSPLLATPVPLVKMEYHGSTRKQTLVIFLPGIPASMIDDLAEDFERMGKKKSLCLLCRQNHC